MLRVSLVSLFFCTCASALSPHRLGWNNLTLWRSAATAAGAPAATQQQQQQQHLMLQHVQQLGHSSMRPIASHRRASGFAFVRTRQEGRLGAPLQRQGSQSPRVFNLPSSWACRRPRQGGPLVFYGAQERSPGPPAMDEMHAAADFEVWGQHLPVHCSATESTEQLPLRERGAPRVPGAIDVHFGSPEAPVLQEAPEGPPGCRDTWKHLQLPIETFLFLAVDSQVDALRFLKEGAPHLLQGAHSRSGGPPSGPLGADVYELRLAQASLIEAAAAAVQRRVAAQSGAPKGKSGFEALRKDIERFFDALYARVAEGPSQQQKQQQQCSLLHKAAEAWEEFREALFSPEELPPFDRVPVVAAKGRAPLWEVRRATGVGGPSGSPVSRKLLLRLPQLALHEALLPPHALYPDNSLADAALAAAPAAPAAEKGELALRWAVLNAMVRYRELLDPQAPDLIEDLQSSQGHFEGPQGASLAVGLSPSAYRRRMRLLRSLGDIFSSGVQKGGRSGGPKGRRANPLWLLPLGTAIKAWLEASPATTLSDGGASAPLQLSLSKRRQLSSWLGASSRLDLSSVFHALLHSGAARDSGEAVSLLEGLLAFVDLQPPDLDAIEAEVRRETEKEAGTFPVPGYALPLETDNATVASLLAIPAFVETLTLEGVDAAARVVAPLMAQLNQQAHTLAYQLGLPSAKVQGDSTSSRPARAITRSQLLEQRREFLLLLNAMERRLLMAVVEALEGSILGGTGLHARRLTPEPDGPRPADDEEAAVRTFIEAQMFLRDLFHTMRQTLRLKELSQGDPLDMSSPTPVEELKASISFPSFSDVLSPAEGSLGSPNLKQSPTLATPHALATAAARLFAFFHINCFGRSLPSSLRLRISRGLNSPAASSCHFSREIPSGFIKAEWIIHIHPDVQHLPLLASSLLSSMFAVYKDAVLPPRAILPAGVPSLEGTSKETEDRGLPGSPQPGSCCKAVGLWQAIRQAAERNRWPFYVGLQGGEPLQPALASSIAPQQGPSGDPARVLRPPRPLLDELSGKLAPGLPTPEKPLGGALNNPPSATPVAAPGSVSAALTLSGIETQVLLRAAENELEQEKILKVVEACSAERYEGSGLRSPFLSRLTEEGLEPQRAVALLNALAERQRRLPQSQEVSSLMAVSRPETAESPVVAPSPKVEGHLAAIAKDWSEGEVPFLPMVHALWAGERGTAAGAAAAGALTALSELGAETHKGPMEKEEESKPLNTWAWKMADKMGRDAVGASFLLRWLEGHSRGDHHSTECLLSSSIGVDLRGVVAQGSPSKGPAFSASEALLREGLKYLEDLHVVEHQQQHAQRLLTMQHVLRSGNNPAGLSEAVSQVCGGHGAFRAKEAEAFLSPELSPEEGTATLERKRAEEGEAALKAALGTGGRQLTEDSERHAMAERLYALFNSKCFSHALPPKPQLVFEDPNAISTAGGTLHRASSPSVVPVAHAADIRDFRRPPIIYIHPGVRDVFLLAHLLLQQMVQLLGRVYQPFTTLGVDTPKELKEHITGSQLAPLAEQYASKLAKMPLTPPVSDGLQRIQTLARPEVPQPDDPSGFMSLSRFFESSVALPAMLKEAGNMSGEAAAAQQQRLSAAARAAADAAAKAARGEATPQNHQALHLLAAEAAQTVTAASPNPDDLSPAPFLDALEFVQMEAARHYAREGTAELPVVMAAPGEDEEDSEALEQQSEGGAPKGKGSSKRDWRELLSPAESIRLVKHALLNKDGAGGTSLLGDLVESGSTSFERGLEILAEAVAPQEN